MGWPNYYRAKISQVVLTDSEQALLAELSTLEPGDEARPRPAASSE